ncbi:hypothetical protein [Parvicella tangerina]|uniref:Uncharacterized protein n=1 Tax=Parvicella tangerina TaxID=2829795 RepID=A0A916JML8_9FLAO|nr:hypothetical protein [Parvicella tangerina]CAG5082272.1 hypothetical protein CRYO30217_01861 [Parvicella tangerina]
MRFDLLPYQKPFNLVLTIKALRPVKLIISIFNPISGAQFIYRKVSLMGLNRLLFKLPIVSDRLRVEIECKDLPLGDAHYVIERIEIKRDTKCPVELTERDKRFIKFAKWFALNLKEQHVEGKGVIYQSDEFTILLQDKIEEEGEEVSTPARVGKKTGVIQVSKTKLIGYSVPMLIVLLLHEYAHRYKNAEYGRQANNELSADLIALNIALNLGFDAVEVLRCFKAVFGGKKSKLNKRRWAAIQEFVKRFKAAENKRCSI